METPTGATGLNHLGRWLVQWTEPELLEACRKGEPAAFEELVRRHERQVYRVAYRLVQNRLDAQEIVQEIFVRVHRALPQFRAGAALGTWLYRITVNACLDWKRRVRIRGEVPLDSAPEQAATGTDPSARAGVRELAERVAAAFEELPPRQRAVLVLRVYEELSLQEIAEVLEAPLGTVKAHYHQALTKVRAALSDLREPGPGKDTSHA